MSSRSLRRSAVAVASGLITACACSAPALAAGSGYGGPPPSNSTPPTGFNAIVTAKTIGSHGGTVKGRTAGGSLDAQIPSGASNKPLQVAITQGRSSTVRSDLPAFLKHFSVVASFGIELKHGAAAAKTSEAITLTYQAIKVARGDVVVIYDPSTHRFRLAAATVRKGRMILHLRASESIAILEPKRK